MFLNTNVFKKLLFLFTNHFYLYTIYKLNLYQIYIDSWIYKIGTIHFIANYGKQFLFLFYMKYYVSIKCKIIHLIIK